MTSLEERTSAAAGVQQAAAPISAPEQILGRKGVSDRVVRLAVVIPIFSIPAVLAVVQVCAMVDDHRRPAAVSGEKKVRERK